MRFDQTRFGVRTNKTLRRTSGHDPIAQAEKLIINKLNEEQAAGSLVLRDEKVLLTKFN
jgi:hypothetical protein